VPVARQQIHFAWTLGYAQIFDHHNILYLPTISTIRCLDRETIQTTVVLEEHLNTSLKDPTVVQNVNARGTIYSMWIILRKCEGGCEARLMRSIEQIW